MRISYQNEPLYPGKPAPSFTGRLYRHYEQSERADTLTSGLHWFDFHTREAHTLNVRYPSSFYKMVLCIDGKSHSLPNYSPEYGFSTGQALFYRTDEQPYTATLAADTQFKVIHIHLSEALTAMLQKDVPVVFDRPVSAMKLSAGCTNALSQLKNLSNAGLLRLFEEKLITDQLFHLASHALGHAGKKDILEEAIWHIRHADGYLTISELSRLTGTNTFRLKQLFREQMGTSVFRYQADFHLERAAQLLLDTQSDVAEIAMQCGYESAAAFSNAFLRKYSVRPSAFKNSRLHK